MLLTRPQFAAAKRFLETQARSLELAQFRYAFEGGTTAAVMAALEEFQNPDGGFGHGLEPDVRTPDSSVICTTIAFQVMRSLALPPAHPCWVRGLDFLVQSYNPETVHWRTIPRSAEQSPHAPWWSQAESPESYDAFSLNPTAEVLGYLYEARDRVPHEIINPVTDKVLSTVLSLDSIEMHDLLCCLRLGRTRAVPSDVHTPLMEKLAALVPKTVDQHPEQWAGYGLRPLQVVDRPNSPWMPGLEAAVEANLDYEIASQNEQGAWTPTWSWAETFPEAWAMACQEWAGVLTLGHLLTLKRFNRLEESAPPS
jgi:hypothetical protein